jgi:hypothetical protein
MLPSVGTKYKSTLVDQQSDEESNVSHINIELGTETQQIANALNYTISKIELVVSPLNT